MAKKLTEDAVRDKARDILGFKDKDGVRSGVGQLTTFNQLGFAGVADKPDGWYLPDNHADTAIVLETKASYITLGDKQVDEVLKNVKIVQEQYGNVVGILYNGDDTRVFKGEIEFQGNGSNILHNLEYYISLFNKEHIDKEYIYELTAKINNCLHFEFGIKNLYHRMIFTACALVAKRYDALMVKGMDYSEFHNAILNCLNKELMRDKRQNQKLSLLSDVFSEIRMNLNVDSEDAKEQQRVKDLIGQFIDWVSDISDCLNSDAWRGEDVILKHHRLRKVIKLPEDVFFNVGVTTSVFIFETGIPQDKNEFFACWMESDGLATVKNKGRNDDYNKWSAIEDKWVDIVMKQSGDDTCQWVNPEEHLSYQMPQKPFEIFEEDFRKTAMDYIMFQKGIDTKDFGEKLLERAMYSSCVSADDDVVTVTMQKGDDSDGKD